MLEFHPLAFPLAGIVELVVLAVILVWLPSRTLASAVAFCVTLAQSAVAVGWLIRFGPPGWVGALGVLLVAERLWRVANRDHASRRRESE